MSHHAGTLLLLCLLYAGFAQGMDCAFGTNKNVFSEVLNHCPGVFDSSDKSFCCYDLSEERAYCCTAEEFTKSGLGIIIPVIIAAGIVISLIVCCISCLCCSCCPWYRRRRQGTVYGKVQTPTIVHVVQSNVPPPSYNQAAEAQQNHYVPYPTNPAGIPQPPPQYTSEVYAKQAPYNPAYQPQ